MKNEKENKKKTCEYDSFWDCHANKDYCKKHFRITSARPPKEINVLLPNKSTNDSTSGLKVTSFSLKR